jgi:hypothetical protein
VRSVAVLADLPKAKIDSLVQEELLSKGFT